MDAIQGFTRLEIINNVLDSIGRTGDATLQTRLQSEINVAQLSFWKLFDWKWGRKNGVADSVRFLLVDGQNNYTLSAAVCGKALRATDIDKLYIIDDTYARTLTKVEARDIRIGDPSGSSTGAPTTYAITKHNEVILWPIPDATMSAVYVYIDSKVLPTFLDSDDDYPDIPIEYQETFQQYLLYRTLSRENDPRQETELVIFEKMLAADRQTDMAEIENNVRLRWPEEELIDSHNQPGLFNDKYNFWND